MVLWLTNVVYDKFGRQTDTSFSASTSALRQNGTMANGPDWPHLATTLRGLHRALMERARRDYEKARDIELGAGRLLQLLLSDPHFSWLRALSDAKTRTSTRRKARSGSGKSHGISVDAGWSLRAYRRRPAQRRRPTTWLPPRAHAMVWLRARDVL